MRIKKIVSTKRRLKTNRPNIQEIMIERAHEAAGDIDEVWDTYVSGDIKSK